MIFNFMDFIPSRVVIKLFYKNGSLPQEYKVGQKIDLEDPDLLYLQVFELDDKHRKILLEENAVESFRNKVKEELMPDISGNISKDKMIDFTNAITRMKNNLNTQFEHAKKKKKVISLPNNLDRTIDNSKNSDYYFNKMVHCLEKLHIEEELTKVLKNMVYRLHENINIRNNNITSKYNIEKSLEEIHYPDTWVMQNEDTEIVNVDSNSNEFKKIVSEFYQTDKGNEDSIKNVKIINIQRIQNKSLFKYYYLKKKEIEKKRMNKGNAREKWLYHASNSKYIKFIKNEGLDPRLAKMTGSIGVAVYYSKSSRTSLKYVNEDDNIKHILYCRVLVGRSIKGKSGIRRPPYLFNTDVLADSTHGEICNDKMWGIFDQYQSYPEYIIQLENTTSN